MSKRPFFAETKIKGVQSVSLGKELKLTKLYTGQRFTKLYRGLSLPGGTRDVALGNWLTSFSAAARSKLGGVHEATLCQHTGSQHARRSRVVGARCAGCGGSTPQVVDTSRAWPISTTTTRDTNISCSQA